MDNIAENMIQPPPEGGDQTFSKIVATHRSPPPPVPQKPLKKCSSRSRSSSSAESLSTITSPATPQLHLISAPSQDNFPPNSGPNLHQESLPKEVMSLLGIAEITSQGVKTVSEIAPVIDHNPDKVKVGPNLDQNPNLDSLDLNNLAKEGDPINHGQDPKPVPAQTAPDSHPPVSSGTCTSTSCPFQSFHNKNVNISEFLAFGQTPSEPSLTTRPTLKKVDDTIHFLVENIKDGTGIWPSVFLEKLIRLIVTSRDAGVSTAFCEDDYSVLYKLVDAFSTEKRCGLVWRYYCLFYNVMSRVVVPLEEICRTQLFPMLQQDFLLAASNRCRCRPGPTLSSSEFQEHSVFTPTMLLGLASYLLIPIYTQLATQGQNQNPGQLLDPEVELHLATALLRLICDAETATIFPDASNSSKSILINLLNTKPILVNLLISQNLCQGPTLQNNGILSALSALDCDASQLKDRLLSQFIQELLAFEQGFTGIQTALNIQLSVPLGLQLSGLMGPIKLFNDILTLRNFAISTSEGDSSTGGVDTGFFNVDDLAQLESTSRAILEVICTRTGQRDEEIQLNTRALLTILQQRIHHIHTQAKIIYKGPSFLEVGMDFGPSAGINMTLANSRFTLGGGGIGDEGKRSILSKKVMLWPFGRMLRWFGCSKRMASSSVGPASVRDVEYLRFDSKSNGWTEGVGDQESGSGSGPSTGSGCNT